MKLKAPDNMGGFTYKDAPIHIPADRLVEARDDAMASVMISHGFVPMDETLPTPSAQVADDSQRQKVAASSTNMASTSTRPGNNAPMK